MDLLAELKQLKSQRSNFNTQYELLGKFVSQVKRNFTTEHESGEFLNEDIFDSTGTFASHSASSALLGMLFPTSAKKSVMITAPDEMGAINEEEKKYYERATNELVSDMDRREGNLILSLDEYMLDQMIFGTAGVGTFYEDGRLMFRSYGLEEMHIDEGKNNRVNKVFLSYKWTAAVIIANYGEDNVSDSILKANASNSSEKFNVIIAYIPNDEGETKAIHTEETTGFKLREEDYEEFPLHVGRFRKLLNEKYGRSLAMNALPDIQELNILREAIIVATEKSLDPPLGVLSDSMIGNGVIDTSAGAISVFDSSGNMGNSSPVFPLNTVGELNVAYQRVNDLKDSIAQHFNIDRLLDFNNETQMTATETTQRAIIRNNSLSSLLNRQVVEVFTPLVERSFNLLMRNDRLGYTKDDPAVKALESMGEEVWIIPDRIAKRIAKGLDSYQVNFTTPADRMSSSEEANGLLQTIDMIQRLMQSHPKMGAYLDEEGIANNITKLFGSPPETISSSEKANAKIEAEQKAMQQAQALETAQSVAQTAKTANEAQNQETA